MKKIIKKIKENFSYKEKNEMLLMEIKELINEIDKLENEVTILENKLDTNTQALMIDRLEKTILGYRETIKKLRESDNKRMKTNIEIKEKLRNQEDKIKRLEQDLRISKKISVK